MPETALWRLTASEASKRLAAGALTSEALTRACLDRIAERDGALKAWTYVDADAALRRARELDKQPRRGPLHGLPVAVKDMIETADQPTTYNSSLFQGHRPAQDAASVAVLRAGGALILGKTETTEFAAAGRNAATGNPHDLAHTSGGSSAGSAAAVGDFHAPLALGTQTGGSLIRPASFCGVYAFKPTWGQVSREGAKFYSVSLDTIGWYGRSAADLDLLAELYGLPGAPDPLGPASGLRFALCRSPEWAHAQEGTKRAMEMAAERLRRAGAEVVELQLPEAFAGLNPAHKRILYGEGRTAFLPLYLEHGDRLDDDFRHRVENRDGFSPQELVAAYDLAADCRKAFDEIARGFDAVVTPSAPGEAPEGRIPGDPVFNQPWTLLHAPVIHLPVTKGARGLPVGVSLVGPRMSDRRLLAVAAAAAEALEDAE